MYEKMRALTTEATTALAYLTSGAGLGAEFGNVVNFSALSGLEQERTSLAILYTAIIVAIAKVTDDPRFR